MKKNEKDFGEELFDFCTFDCFFYLYNQSFDCIHFIFSFISIDISWNKDTNCMRFLMLSKTFHLLFQLWTNARGIVNQSVILSILTLKLKSQNKFWMKRYWKWFQRNLLENIHWDFNQLVYNCGGILGLWFGISPMKAVNLFSYIHHIYRILINICAKVSQFWIAIWIRIKR
jgi:hypothetical protein